MQTVPWSRLRPYRFQNLPSFTRKEIALWNWYRRIGPEQTEWRAWVAEIFGHLLERPAGQQLQLVQTHQVDSQFGEKVLSFGSKQELFIGRGPDNDVALSADAIAKRHTRVVLKDGQPYIEDLGSRLGTYLWDKKIQPNEIRLLRNGDQFTVFPYRFRVVLEQCWSPETEVALSELGLQGLTRAEFFQLSPAGWRIFVVNAHPSGERALLEVSPSFLARLQQRMFAPMGLDRVKIPVPSDDALVGFTILAVLEHLNRRLKFPVQFSLGRGTRAALADATRGMLLSFAVGVGGLTGQVRIFLPLEYLSKYKSESSVESGASYPAGLCWRFPVSGGFVDLSANEIAQIGLGDILLTQRSDAILVPTCGSGWAIVPDGSNSAKFQVDKYFERSTSVEMGREGTASVSKPDIETLPLRLHVIVGEKEFTLAEVQSLGPGTIVELDSTKSDPVRLMVNGKILGEGELVEVEGNLGVKVLRWRTS
ncbi:MAG: FliM/FliN family flagellar motor switch protein [Terriglobales bacterium]